MKNVPYVMGKCAKVQRNFSSNYRGIKKAKMTAMHLHRQFRESHLENGVKVKYSFEIKPPLHNYNSY